jgi:hypothetical protein
MFENIDEIYLTFGQLYILPFQSESLSKIE